MVTEEQNERLKIEEILGNKVLNQIGKAMLISRGIWTKLIMSLSLEGSKDIEKNNIFFNPLSSPAFMSIVKQSIPENSKLITIDINSLKEYNREEFVAIILHEIKHALNSMQDEFTADEYAINRVFMLNEHGQEQGELIKRGIGEQLISSLYNDIIEIANNSVFFNPLSSPASTSIVNQSIPENSKLITIDINSLKEYNREESIAIILHEIGHALNSMQNEFTAEQKEFTADEYAINRGFGQYLIDALEKGKELHPCEFDKDITEKRIDKIKQIINNH
jgi:hypothetical protein